MNRRFHKIVELLPYFIILVIFIPQVMLSTQTLGSAIAQNSDIVGYFESLRKMYLGISAGDWQYAFNINTFGYGAGLFIILEIVTYPLFVFGVPDTLILICLRGFNLACFLLCILVLKYICLNLRFSKNYKYSNADWYFTTIVISLFPATSLMITHVHPEILQLFFILLGILLYLKYTSTKKFKYFILMAAAWGLEVSVKISGGIFLVIPYILIIFDASKSVKSRLKEIVVFTIECGLLSFFLLIPYCIVDFREGLMNFLNELAYFTRTLESKSFSDFDNYKVLHSRKEVLIGWLTYAFSHGYAALIWIAVMILSILVLTVRNIRKGYSRILTNLNVGVLCAFLINCTYYMLNVMRISTYYYFSAVCLLTFIFGINVIYAYKAKQKTVIYIFLTLTVISLVPGFIHDISIYQGQIVTAKRLANSTYRYKNFKTWLDERNYPYTSIMLPASMNLNISSNELNWIPDYDAMDVEKRIKLNTEGGYLDKLLFYWTFDDVWNMNPKSVLNSDIFVVDKMGDSGFQNTEKFLEQNDFTKVYNDNFVSAFSNSPLGIEDSNINQAIASILNTNAVDINFHGEWNGINIDLAPTRNIKSHKQILFSFHAKNSKKISEVRLVFRSGKEQENTWHYVIKAPVKEGSNSFHMDYEDFIVQQGFIDWQNVNYIGIGGIGEDGSSISDFAVLLN